ncbi:MAG: GTP cyclohydrolase I FolE2 [Piscirickettsiaceae bacterium]|nr:GTP cyclohydrolase I FolE2 [Piscirickettsiaceae bacterium]
MTTDIKPDCCEEIEDVQNIVDRRHIAIDKVGIKNIKHPIIVSDRNNRIQHTIANFNMYVNLPHRFKGTHMSRFVEILNQYECAITIVSFREMLNQMTKRLQSKHGFIQIYFPYFVNKEAPVSKVKSLMDYKVSFIGEIIDDKTVINIKVIVPVTSLCPCSKNISDYGAHNQRSHVSLTVRVDNNIIWVEDLIDLIEREASCEIFGSLKRLDEKYVTERAYDNPKFVEDIVRDIAAKLNNDNRINAYTIESENFESIHNHSAYASIKNGF